MARREIPAHLSGCPVQGGLPVPMVVCPVKGRIGLGPAKWPGMDLQTEWEPDPDCRVLDFGKYDEEKLRRSIAERRCHVCWDDTDASVVCVPRSRWPYEGQTIDIDGRTCPMVIQPWVCVPCLAYAVGACPPLGRAIAEGRGLVFYVRRHRLVYTHWKPANPEDPAPPAGAKVLSFIKIAIQEANTFRLARWAKVFGREVKP
ncbi:MAG: hypothetical protein IT435_05505 [Phycisphaerales bacterium]|nr:hypothetical protein [Phycisphaerales bacterium]